MHIQSTHCRPEWIDKEGKWTRDWSHKCSDGSTKEYVEGESAKNLLLYWRLARDRGEHSWDEHILVWGQPRAWTDELISVWAIEHIAECCGQSVVQLDCLASQWSEPVLLQAWLKNLIWCPLPPDATSYLQEPDTHEHSQLKAEYRKAKADLHFQLEQEYRNSHKNAVYVPKWGALRGSLHRWRGLAQLQGQEPSSTSPRSPPEQHARGEAGCKSNDTQCKSNATPMQSNAIQCTSYAKPMRIQC